MICGTCGHENGLLIRNQRKRAPLRLFFLEDWARRAGVGTAEEALESGYQVRSCDCGAEYCNGWEVVLDLDNTVQFAFHLAREGVGS